ncbi:hypothetical protein PENPOL_c005G10145 [Penicillium polonicum]|uniref:SMP-30/Gluconolactonase/LRE-like region domain-containing protein n=1 Tax=Penicillium polonicum TaxID=60169 RepID=A0A1V6NMU1_PENPO|nr:hypothetical protein PENPOL_c005G10145 [Penicillium polonicum]
MACLAVAAAYPPNRRRAVRIYLPCRYNHRYLGRAEERCACRACELDYAYTLLPLCYPNNFPPLTTSFFHTSISRVHPHLTSLHLNIPPPFTFIHTPNFHVPKIISCSVYVTCHYANARKPPLSKRPSKARHGFCEDQESIREDTDHIAKMNKNAQAGSPRTFAARPVTSAEFTFGINGLQVVGNNVYESTAYSPPDSPDEWKRLENSPYNKATSITFLHKDNIKSLRTITDRRPIDPDPKGTPSKIALNVTTRSATTRDTAFVELPEQDNEQHPASHMTVNQEDSNSDSSESPPDIRDASMSPSLEIHETDVNASTLVSEPATKRLREWFGNDFDKDFTTSLISMKTLKARGWLEDGPKVTLQFETALEWGPITYQNKLHKCVGKADYSMLFGERNHMACHLVVFEAKQDHGASTSDHGQILASELVVNRPPDGRSSDWDDFAIDESGNAYVAQPANTIVKIAPDGMQSVIGGGGDSLAFIGPTSVQIVPGGRLAYVTTGGGDEGGVSYGGQVVALRLRG